MIQTQENNEKPYFEPDLGPLGLNSGRKFFFSKIWLHHSLDIMYNIRKNNDPILRKFSDGQIDGQECFDRTLPD